MKKKKLERKLKELYSMLRDGVDENRTLHMDLSAARAMLTSCELVGDEYNDALKASWTISIDWRRGGLYVATAHRVDATSRRCLDASLGKAITGVLKLIETNKET